MADIDGFYSKRSLGEVLDYRRLPDIYGTHFVCIKWQCRVETEDR